MIAGPSPSPSPESGVRSPESGVWSPEYESDAWSSSDAAEVRSWCGRRRRRARASALSAALEPWNLKWLWTVFVWKMYEQIFFIKLDVRNTQLEFGCVRHESRDGDSILWAASICRVRLGVEYSCSIFCRALCCCQQHRARNAPLEDGGPPRLHRQLWLRPLRLRMWLQLVRSACFLEVTMLERHNSYIIDV